MMFTSLFSLPIAVLWMMLSGEYSVVSFGIGYVVGFAILWLIYPQRDPNVNLARIPLQVVWIVYYCIYVFVDIVRSSVDVAYRVLHPQMPINPGLVTITTLDESKNQMISALTAHAITLTPGELVVDFVADDEMIVHVLDIDSAETQEAQKRRLKLLRKVLGND